MSARCYDDGGGRTHASARVMWHRWRDDGDGQTYRISCQWWRGSGWDEPRYHWAPSQSFDLHAVADDFGTLTIVPGGAQ